MKREIKFRAWHKETCAMLNIWSYQWNKGYFAGTDRSNEYFNNEFEITPDGNGCNRVTGKSVFMTFDGQVIGVVPIDDKTTQSVNYSHEYEIMQFTGLKDKNGKDIYEGDIVNMVYDEPYNRPHIIVWNINKFIAIHLTQYKRGNDFFDAKLPNAFKAEVIGNIYENPELL